MNYIYIHKSLDLLPLGIHSKRYYVLKSLDPLRCPLKSTMMTNHGPICNKKRKLPKLNTQTASYRSSLHETAHRTTPSLLYNMYHSTSTKTPGNSKGLASSPTKCGRLYGLALALSGSHLRLRHGNKGF